MSVKTKQILVEFFFAWSSIASLGKVVDAVDEVIEDTSKKNVSLKIYLIHKEQCFNGLQRLLFEHFGANCLD